MGSLSSLQKLELLKLLILIFHVIFFFFSDFIRSNSFIVEPKVEKIYMGVFSTHFVLFISILPPKLMEE